MKSKAVLLGLALVTSISATAVPVSAENISLVAPDTVGLSAERLDDIDRAYADQVDKGEIAGAVILIARHGKVAHYNAIGYANVETKEKMQKDNIFRLYSMTKPVASTALMQLYQQGRFQLTDPIAKYLPEFANARVADTVPGSPDATVAAEHAPTIADVLRHTAGFTHGLSPSPYDMQYVRADLFSTDISLAEEVTRLAKIPLHYQPGTKWEYSIGTDVAARLVEVLSGMPFDQYLEKEILKPLKMADTGFWVPPANVGRLVPVNWFKDGKLTTLDEAHGYPMWGWLTDPKLVNSYTVNHQRKGGSFGLVGTAPDYWRFAQAMANGGKLGGVRILDPQTTKLMMTNQIGDLKVQHTPDPRPNGLGFGYGFAVIKDPAAEAGYPGTVGTVFWNGAAGTQFWIDPTNDMVVVVMIQQFGPPGTEAMTIKLHGLVARAIVK